jgi:HAE1 family hydrophobic/amphiphilic exporter-1
MPALSTIAGIIAIGFGTGAESRRQMGVCVIGGMLSSTILTLFVIPVVYTAFNAVAGRFSKPAPAPTPSPAPSADVVPVT